MVKAFEQVNQQLMRTVRGKEKADCVIQGATLVNVLTEELIEDIDVYIKGERIVYVGTHEALIGEETQVIDATGKFLAPGLMDGHMHVESTMLSVTNFAEKAATKGTTAVFMDPHEMANVFGAEGVEKMHEEGRQAPIHVFTTYPSCVPAAVNLEDAGAVITPEDVESGLELPGMAGLGEMMNYPGVLEQEVDLMAEISATTKRGLRATGHFPEGTDQDLQTYLLSGVDSCHETISREEALRKLRLGMYVMIREGSAWQDVKEVIKVITEDNVATDHIMLVTDDIDPETLVEKGQMNHVIKRAIEEGVSPVVAIKLATINTARYFGLDRDYGSISPGKVADIILVSDLDKMEPTHVFCKGTLISESGDYIKPSIAYKYPKDYYQSVHLKTALEPRHFDLETHQKDQVKVHAIEIIENSARTKRKVVTLPVHEGCVQASTTDDVIHLSCIERHGKNQSISNQFVHGFSIKKGAVASTVAHDSHNLLVMGVNKEDMAIAGNRLAEIGGGMVAVLDGKIIAEVALPIAGLMSDLKADDLLIRVKGLEKAWQQMGSTIHAPFMTFSLIALPVIPDCRISNRGLIDVLDFKLIDTFL